MCCVGCTGGHLGMMFGPGNAGKTTLVKALRLALCKPPVFGDDELTHFHNVAIANVIESAAILAKHAEKLYPEEYNELKKHLSDLDSIKQEGSVITNKRATTIEAFWKSELCRKVWDRRLEFDVHLNDNTKHFLPMASKVRDENYTLTNLDILMVREETKLLSQYKLKTSQSKLKTISILDRGGQENHQKEYELKDSKLFRKYADDAQFLFVVIPIGDLFEEEKNGSIVKGLRILNSLLEISAKTNDGVWCPWSQGKEYVNFKNKGILVILNKQDKLPSGQGVETHLSNWVQAAKSRSDCDPWLRKILDEDVGGWVKQQPTEFYENLIYKVKSQHPTFKGKMIIKSDSLIDYDQKLINELTTALCDFINNTLHDAMEAEEDGEATTNPMEITR